MIVEIRKNVDKEIEKTPIYIQLKAAEQVEKLKAANSLSELDNVRRLEGMDEPYYRMTFGKYRFIFYYDDKIKKVDIRRFKHRKDAYKKHNLPWR